VCTAFYLSVDLIKVLFVVRRFVRRCDLFFVMAVFFQSHFRDNLKSLMPAALEMISLFLNAINLLPKQQL